MKTDFQKPPVTVSSSGVHSVKAADIFRSAAGQTAIKQMANLSLESKKGTGR